MADAVVVNTPDEQSGPVKATATTLTFTRENHAMLLEGQARIERQGDTLTADQSHAVHDRRRAAVQGD